MRASSFSLAWRDYWHEWLLSLCSILGLVAVLAPLLVLGGVRNGIISGMQQQLLDDPRNLELIPAGSGFYDDAWLGKVGALEGAGFIVAQTRSIAASMDIYQPQTQRSQTMDVIATAPGDPLLKRWDIAVAMPEPAPPEPAPPEPALPELAAPMPVVLSASAALSLQAAPGQIVRARVGRVKDGRRENAGHDLIVQAVLPAEAQAKLAAYVPLAFLVALEDYRDGRAVPEFHWPGEPRPETPRTYASFRLYAASLDDVAPLAERLSNDNLQISTRAQEISLVKNLDNSFAIIFWLISGAAIFGFSAAVASNSLATVKRKIRSLAILRLMGFGRGFMLRLPLWQSGFTAFFGFLLSCGLYWLVAFFINRLFADMVQAGQKVCHLAAWHFAVAGLATMLLCGLASMWGAAGAAKIDPAEVIRDV